ncbi:uncharacterized protein LOC119730637 [Patiria miniata]|uniref:F5/8 type C domain-containing protein n=1 Tax=Patiria miniata TaxID=46514 RepID=A0A914A6X9_PATMI|nr:uncharacterized protein LOC119730637 [Patiria miniata]
MEGLGLLILTVLITARQACVAAGGTLYVARENQALVGHTFLSLHATSLVQCMVLCHRHRRCLSFNHCDTDGTCQMNDARAEENPESLQQKSGFLYFGGLESDTEGPMETTTETVQVSTNSQGQGDELDESAAAMSTVLVLGSQPEVVGVSQPSPDFEAPTVTCPNAVWSYTNGGEAQAKPDWAPPTAVDNLDGEIPSSEITCVNDLGLVVGPGDGFYKGVTTVWCEAYDSVRNMGTCLFNVSIIDCGGCAPLGMEDGTIPDDQIGASSVLNSSDDANYGPGLARLNGAKSWCAPTPQLGPLQWISVSLSRQADVYGVIVQGRPSSDMFVTNFIVYYRDDALQGWSHIREDTGSLTTFDSSKSGETAVHVPFQSASRDYIHLGHLRITPIKWQTAVCMRLEIIGKTTPFSVDG